MLFFCVEVAEAEVSGGREESTENTLTAVTAPSSRDIGHLIVKSKESALTDNDREEALKNRWSPMTIEDCPYSFQNQKGKVWKRRLGISFFLKDSADYKEWLAVSKVESVAGAWCVFCALFKTNECGGGKGAEVARGGGQKMGALINKPLTNYKDLTGKDGKLDAHERTHFHTRCQLVVAEFQKRVSGAGTHPMDIQTLIASARLKEIEENREVIFSLLDILLTSARQDIATRGHRDDGRIDFRGLEPDENDGNWRSLIRLSIRQGNKTIAKHLQEARSNALYCSKTIQNELLDASSCLIKEIISNKCTRARFYALLADETLNRAMRESLAIVIRYVEKKNDEWVVNEDPIAVVDLLACCASDTNTDASDGQKDDEEYDPAAEDVKLSGKAIGTVLSEQVKKLQLSDAVMVGCGFDGAPSMASQTVGAAGVLKENHPLADYFHCCMHALNLSASTACTIHEIRHCEDIVSQTVSFIQHSAKRTRCLKKVIKHRCPETKRKKLVSLCKTRFIERHEAILVYYELLPYLVEALQGMMHWDSQDTRTGARQILAGVQSTSFLVALMCLEAVSALLRPVSISLQKPGSDIVAALQQVTTVIDIFKSWLDAADVKMSELFGKVSSMAEKLDIQLVLPRVPRRSVYRSNAGGTACTSVEQYYRINVFIPLLNTLINDLDRRFGAHQRSSMSLSALIPAYLKSWEDLKPAVEKYSDHVDSLVVVEGEFLLWRQFWSTKATEERLQCSSALKTLSACSEHAFPNLHTLLRILATLPTTTAEPERVFSKVNRTLSAIRATMSEDRLEALILLQVHRNLPLKNEDIVEKFAKTGARRLKLLM